MSSAQKKKTYISETPISPLVECLYRSLVDDEALQEFLDGCSNALSSDSVVLLQHNYADPEKSLLFFNSNTDADERHYHRFASRGDFVDKSLPYLQPGTVVRLPNVLEESLFQKTQFYEYFCVEHNFSNGMAITIHADYESLVVLLFNRPGNEPYDPEDQRWLERLAPHLLNYYRLSGHVRSLDLRLQRAHKVLDSLNLGIAMIGASKTVRFMNRRAQALVGRSDSLDFEKGQLRSRKADIDKWLSSRIREASQSMANFNEARFSMLLHEGNERLHLFVLPLKSRKSGSLRSCAVLLTDLQIDTNRLSSTLAAMYGLSARESQVAALLTQGLPTIQIAEQMQIKESTVRTLIKRVFAKTEVTRQADLIRIGLSMNLH